MFKRRDSLSIARKTRAMIWPEMGWRRAWRYLGHRVGRLPGSGYAIAGGFAWGAAMSFTPLIGFHILFSALGAWVTRCSVVAAVIGTAIGNPWTIRIWLYKAGTAMGFGAKGVDAETMDFSALFDKMSAALMHRDWTFLADHAMPVLTPMLAAALPTALIVWVIFFLLLKPTIERYKSGIAARRTTRPVMVIEPLQQEQESTI